MFAALTKAGAAPPGAERTALVEPVALAHHWAQRLEEGAYASTIEIAEAYGMSERYVWKILRLAHLAPDIVEAILDGAHPMDLTLRRLNDTQIASDWREQRAALAFAYANSA